VLFASISAFQINNRPHLLRSYKTYIICSNSDRFYDQTLNPKVVPFLKALVYRVSRLKSVAEMASWKIRWLWNKVAHGVK